MKTIFRLVRGGSLTSSLMFLAALVAGESPQVAWMAGGHFYGATGVRFTSDGRHLVSGGSGLKVWDWSEQRLERTLSYPRGGDDWFALSSDDRWVASVPWSPDRGLVVREVRDGAEHARFDLEPQATPPLSLSFSPDNAWLLASTADGRLLRWHLPTRTALAPQRIDTIKPDLQYGFLATLVSSNEFIGSISTAVFRAQLEPPRLLWDRAFTACNPVAVGPGAQRLAVSLADRLLLLDAASGEVVWETGPTVDAPAHLAFSGDGQRLAGTHQAVDLQVWRAGDGTLELTLPGVSESVAEVAVSPNGRTVAAAYGRGIALWDLEARRGPEDLTQLPSPPYALGVSTNGLVALGTLRGYVAVFELATGRPVVAWSRTAGHRPVALAPSGEWLVTDGTNLTLSVYRLPSGEIEREVPLPGAIADYLELSANGQRLAVMPPQGGPIIVRTADWTVERTIDVRPAPYLRSVCLSPEGDWLAGVDWDGNVGVWRLSDGGRVGYLPASVAGAARAAFDDPAPRLWVLGKQGTMARWNPLTGELEPRPTLATGNIVSAIWLPDRSAVLLSVQDQGLELWRLDTGACVKRYDAEVGRLCYTLAISPDERTLLLGRYDATLVAAGLPFFLDLQPSAPGQLVIQAHGPKTSWRWEAMVEPGVWSILDPSASGPLTVPTTADSRWFRAVLER